MDQPHLPSKLALTQNGAPVNLIVSCLGDGDTGGGLLYHDGQSWQNIDDVSTTGLFVAHGELTRILWAPSQVADWTSILHYTRDGLIRQVTVDGLTDPHDVLWDGRQYVAVSSFQDSVLWITEEGTVTRRFQPAQGEDCWHLNSLLLHEGVLYATAFGRFEQPRGWVSHRREGTGMLFRLDTGADLLTGLCCPHSPRIESGYWVVCNSATSELRKYAVTGELVRCVLLQDWVRGLVITDNYIFVGESVNRQLTEEVRGAAIAVLDRRTWAVLGRLQLPYREVYDLVVAPPDLLAGIQHSPRAQPAVCPPQVEKGF
jgi:uncharacterized protein (TIGR03032 family)